MQDPRDGLLVEHQVVALGEAAVAAPKADRLVAAVERRRATARITALRPGQSPPAVRIPTRISDQRGRSASHRTASIIDRSSPPRPRAPLRRDCGFCRLAVKATLRLDDDRRLRRWRSTARRASDCSPRSSRAPARRLPPRDPGRDRADRPSGGSARAAAAGRPRAVARDAALSRATAGSTASSPATAARSDARPAGEVRPVRERRSPRSATNPSLAAQRLEALARALLGSRSALLLACGCVCRLGGAAGDAELTVYGARRWAARRQRTPATSPPAPGSPRRAGGEAGGVPVGSAILDTRCARRAGRSWREPTPALRLRTRPRSPTSASSTRASTRTSLPITNEARHAAGLARRASAVDLTRAAPGSDQIPRRGAAERLADLRPR